MKPFSLLSPPLLYLHLLFLLTFNLMWFCPIKITAVAAIGNQTDHLALLKFKESITSDPYNALESWNSSIHFCKWHGITCSPMHERVTELSLERYQLHGSLSPHVSNLTFLKSVDITDNNFFGEIPQDLGQLLHLQQLILSNNSFVGEIPTNLTYCSNLKLLYLNGNHLIGKIPTEIGSLKKLQTMSVWRNKLTGGIPSFIGNISSLTRLSVSGNNFEGDIPQEICFLKHLTFLALGEKQFVR
ncbi:putative non-specific serine/threonine protein kinase [Medicago truncatula]|uniref:Putative non-specific serine/threonine protein kinase n=1 Tax=Medicago truncatula TaxID=3880 RepID=A0A396HIH4_MEDTR|nr:putative non-specific serine/threonine protein kinase [Medicago truncatula]